MRQPLRILSIEDDPNDTKLIQELLETEGVVCEVRASIRRLRCWPPSSKAESI
jgi:CheY-like chemotaxis protein